MVPRIAPIDCVGTYKHDVAKFKQRYVEGPTDALAEQRFERLVLPLVIVLLHQRSEKEEHRQQQRAKVVQQRHVWPQTN